MKKLLMALACCSFGLAMAQTPPPALQVGKRLIGSGEQNVTVQNAPRLENAPMVGDYGVYHAPQFLPYYPTAATIWPRVVEVQCRGTVCDGYDWTPDMGRGEYIYIRPVQVVQPPPPPAPIVIQPPPPREIKKKLRE